MKDRGWAPGAAVATGVVLGAVEDQGRDDGQAAAAAAGVCGGGGGHEQRILGSHMPQ